MKAFRSFSELVGDDQCTACIQSINRTTTIRGGSVRLVSSDVVDLAFSAESRDVVSHSQVLVTVVTVAVAGLSTSSSWLLTAVTSESSVQVTCNLKNCLNRNKNGYICYVPWLYANSKIIYSRYLAMLNRLIIAIRNSDKM